MNIQLQSLDTCPFLQSKIITIYLLLKEERKVFKTFLVQGGVSVFVFNRQFLFTSLNTCDFLVCFMQNLI